jgi:hypothetical protein
MNTNSNKLKWNKTKINDFQGPFLAWHSACLVLPREIANNQETDIYRIPEEKISIRNEIKVKILY